MKLTISIDMDNASFYNNKDAEVSSILANLAGRVMFHGLDLVSDSPIRDTNGNSVGQLTIKE